MSVETFHAEYHVAAPRWEKCRTAVAGEESVHKAETKYLPKLPKQDPKDYEAYLMRASFFAATARTLDILTGLIFRKDPQSELTPQLEELAENVNLEGVSLNGFAEDVMSEALVTGRGGILVDHQADVPDARPYMTFYKAEAIRNWRPEIIDGIKTVTQIRLTEMINEPDPEDEFETLEIEQIRVLDFDETGQYRQRLYRKESGKSDFMQFGDDIFPLINGQRMDFIPFVFVNPEDTSCKVKKPPLLDLANTNFSHYRTMADLEHAAHWTALPTPWVAGASEDEVKGGLSIGSSQAWVFRNENTQVGFLEYSGQGMDGLFKLALQKETYMAQLGARILAPEKRAAEAAETEIIRRSGEHSSLAGMANAVSFAIQQALRFMARWLGEAEDSIVYQLNTDYLAVPISAQELTALIAAWQSGTMSEMEVFDVLKRGEMIPEEKTFEEHQAEKDASGPTFNENAPDLDEAA